MKTTHVLVLQAAWDDTVSAEIIGVFDPSTLDGTLAAYAAAEEATELEQYQGAKFKISLHAVTSAVTE